MKKSILIVSALTLMVIPVVAQVKDSTQIYQIVQAAAVAGTALVSTGNPVLGFAVKFIALPVILLLTGFLIHKIGHKSGVESTKK